ncbi:hypothetical protein [Lactobacillus terrae]|uniref:hypothetical protein n=1 Tax=Lactobacillus terrae TaxID=2269374 RepID=UPI000C1B7326|nr:hypothetical protein [Lactobacillus terrae]
MKPTLYEDMETSYGRISDATNCIVREVINGDYTFQFEITNHSKYFDIIQPEMLVYVPVSPVDSDWFYVKSTDVKSGSNTMTVVCNQYSMLSNNAYIRGTLEIDGKTVKQVISEINSKLDLPNREFKFSTDINERIGKTGITYTNSNPAQILMGDANSLVHVLDARVIRKGSEVILTDKTSDKYIDIRKGKNIASVDIQKNLDSLTTSIVPYFTMKDIDTTDPNGDGGGETPGTNWNVQEIKGIITVTVDKSRAYSDDNQAELNREFANGSRWITDQLRTSGSSSQYRIGTNCWVNSSDVSYEQTTDTASYSMKSNDIQLFSDHVPEGHLQYGPEVYSPLHDSYKRPHRKYIDYSSRVNNIPDLIDISSRYFYENPGFDMPTYTISVDTVHYGEKRPQIAKIGDKARIFDKDINLYAQEIVFERTFSPDLMINTSIKAGTYQQTIFRYLESRIKENDQKIDETTEQTTHAVENTNTSVTEVQNNLTESDQKFQEEQAIIQEKIDSVNKAVDDAQTDISNFMNSGGNNIIRWIPTLAEATQMEITTDYGYLLIDDHGMGFHKNNGQVITGMSADGRFYADDIVGDTITGKTIEGGVIDGARITGAAIEGAQYIRLNNGGRVTTSIADYGISTPSITVDEIDGAQKISVFALTDVDGVYGKDGTALGIRNGALYVDGNKVAFA